MEEEIEDLVGDVKYTESQKSVAASNVYSMDFTDSSSDKNNSSGKETYVIEWDDSEDSENVYCLHENQSIINLNDKILTPILVNRNVYNRTINNISQSASASFQKCIAQEIFTQTSKTIIELAETERGIKTNIENKTLETQTSFVSIKENKTIAYRIEVTDSETMFKKQFENDDINYSVTCNQLLSTSLDESSKFPISETETERTDDVKSEMGSFDKKFNIITEEESIERNYCENSSQLDESSKSDTDIDEDSLMGNEYNENKNYHGDNTSDTSEVPKSVDSEVEDLYKKLSERININVEKPSEQDTLRFNTLTPLTEESTVKKESFLDITPNCNNIVDSIEDDKYVLFVNKSGIKVKIFPENETTDLLEMGCEHLKLPPIKSNLSCPSSPYLNFLFGNVQRNANRNFLLERGQREWRTGDRWEIETKDLAAGESPLITARSDSVKKVNEQFQLPPIHFEGIRYNSNSSNNTNIEPKKDIVNKPPLTININDKITELKISNNAKYWPQPKYNISTTESKTSRSVSPESRSPEDSRLGEVAERGCEALCLELLKRLRSSSWFEVSATLEELPIVMEKFWAIVSETRIADLIRQDFYEAVMCLLVKTGSYSRPVRRAANVALDAVVCGVELAHTVTALCVHGAGHKSHLVRCATARLLVVCCALAGGGRELLRTRPPSAACARRHALRALAALLEDKNTETRKYAERLYSMLRPLANFEAFYLTDVEVEVASRQMKKFDQLLLCEPPGEAR